MYKVFDKRISGMKYELREIQPTLGKNYWIVRDETGKMVALCFDNIYLFPLASHYALILDEKAQQAYDLARDQQDAAEAYR
jgi:hypothetical protein